MAGLTIYPNSQSSSRLRPPLILPYTLPTESSSSRPPLIIPYIALTSQTLNFSSRPPLILSYVNSQIPTPTIKSNPPPLILHLKPDPQPMTIISPKPFPYRSNQTVPWSYETMIVTSTGIERPNEAMVIDIGHMTKLGRCYKVPEKEQKRQVEEEEKRKEKGKEKLVEEEQTLQREPEKKKSRVTDKEASDLLKLIRKSEYNIVEQLNRMSAQISILDLLLNSEHHREALLKVFSSANVPETTSPEELEKTVGQIMAPNPITFTEDEFVNGGVNVHIVEIDPLVISASIHAMGFPAFAVMKSSGERELSHPGTINKFLWEGIHERLFLYESDAEKFILNTTNVYDLVFIDAYDGDDVFPRKLWDANSPFLQALKNRLHPEHGTVVVNLHADTDILDQDQDGPFDNYPFLPMGKYVSQVCRAYKDVLIGSGSGVGFVVSAPELCNSSLVVSEVLGWMI